MKKKGKNKKSGDINVNDVIDNDEVEIMDTVQCIQCAKEFEPSDPNDQFCSVKCEIEYLRSENSKLMRKVARKNGEPQKLDCYGVVTWGTCTQEFYKTETFDAKRRATELKHLGFETIARKVGPMPIVNGSDSTELVEMTVLTCYNKEGDESLPPIPKNMIPGLEIEGSLPDESEQLDVVE